MASSSARGACGGARRPGRARARWRGDGRGTARRPRRARSRWPGAGRGAGRRKSAASDVTASQPAKPQTSTAAAGAIAHQPCGANGCRLASVACGSAATVGRSAAATSSAASTSCSRPETRTPPALASGHQQRSAPAAVSSVVARAAAERGRHVRAGEQRRGRRADRDGEVEAPADDGGGPGAERARGRRWRRRRRRGTGRRAPRTSRPAAPTARSARPRRPARPGRRSGRRGRAARSRRCRAPRRWRPPRPAPALNLAVPLVIGSTLEPHWTNEQGQWALGKLVQIR